MRPELFRQLLNDIDDALRPHPVISYRDLKNTLRRMYIHSPFKGERAIGNMYGHIFRTREERHDAAYATRER